MLLIAFGGQHDYNLVMVMPDICIETLQVTSDSMLSRKSECRASFPKRSCGTCPAWVCVPRLPWLLVLFCFGIHVSYNANGGAVSLTSKEVAKLRSLIATNAAAAAQFAAIRGIADHALTETPQPIGKVISAGHLAADPRKIRTREDLMDVQKTECLAWSWAVTGNESYAAQARQFLLAWARVNKSDGQPINETKFEPMVVSYDLLRTSFPPAERNTVDGWLLGKANALIAKTDSQRNNFVSHRLKMVGLIGMAVQDRTLTEYAIHGFRKHIKEDIHPSGASMDYYTRDALHYHIYTIEPLLVLARAAARSGVNLFDYRTSNGATLHAAVDFVVPFAEGRKQHLEFAHSKASFDRKRAKHGEEEYAVHLWEPKTSIGMFSAAAWFSPKYGAIAAKLAGKPEAEFINWQTVLNAVSRD